MKKITTGVVVVAVMLTVSGIGYAGMFDSLKSTVSGGSGGLSKADVNAYFTLSQKADELQQRSVYSLTTMLVNKEAAGEIDRKTKAAQTILDPQEREATLKQVQTENAALLEQQINSKESEEKLAKLDNQQKKLAGAAISNLFLSVLVNKDSLDVAKGIVQKAQANPAAVLGYATELPRIKDAVVNLPGKIEKTYTLADRLLKLAKTSNIEVAMPKNASDKPVEINI